LAAQRTTTIGLGPGVLVPTLRHPMVNASATAALEALAPGRVAVAFGTGFAGVRALGAAPTGWSYLADYVRAFRALLAGATVVWQGSRMQMMHPDRHAPQRPIDVPILISALGPKGLAVATELADGLFTVNGQTGFAARFDWAALGVHGTVLADGEPLDSPRVQAAAGPGNALAYHAAYEFGGDLAHCRAATCGSRPSTKNRRRIAISPCTTNTSSGSTAPTSPPGRRAAGRPSPRPP